MHFNYHEILSAVIPIFQCRPYSSITFFCLVDYFMESIKTALIIDDESLFALHLKCCCRSTSLHLSQLFRKGNETIEYLNKEKPSFATVDIK